MKTIIPIALLTLLVGSCQMKRIENPELTKELNSRKIKKLSEGEILVAAEKLFAKRLEQNDYDKKVLLVKDSISQLDGIYKEIGEAFLYNKEKALAFEPYTQFKRDESGLVHGSVIEEENQFYLVLLETKTKSVVNKLNAQ